LPRPGRLARLTTGPDHEKKLWLKGESSGHFQIVKEIRIDCDEDAILLLIEQKGGACHTGYRSCFFRTIDGKIVGEKVFNPEDVY